MARATITNKQLEEKLIEGNGNFSAVARACGITRQAVQNRVRKSKPLCALVEEITQTKLDVAEDKLFGLIEKGELGAICFLLKTQGKARGYVERAELTGADGGAIEVSSFEKSVLKSYGEPDKQTTDSIG